MSIAARHLPGFRLHLQHGPIDLVIGAEGAEGAEGAGSSAVAARAAAFAAARACFDGMLEELVAELARLRAPLDGREFAGPVARRMARAVAPHRGFVTPMAAVAGAVADQVLAAMTGAVPLARAWVNNGGDIAFHLAPGRRTRLAVAALDGTGLGQVDLSAAVPVRGIATSGRGGRSLSMGIADSVSVLAGDAAAADAAATLIANAVDLPGHPAISRRPARALDPDSDLGARAVVVGLGRLAPGDIAAALDRGAARADRMQRAGLIRAAALFLGGQFRLAGRLPGARAEGAQAEGGQACLR